MSRHIKMIMCATMIVLCRSSRFLFQLTSNFSCIWFGFSFLPNIYSEVGNSSCSNVGFTNSSPNYIMENSQYCAFAKYGRFSSSKWEENKTEDKKTCSDLDCILQMIEWIKASA